jgi:stress response protein SCP2
MLEINAETKPYAGWSSAYTARSVLAQLQALLFDDKALFQGDWKLEQARKLAGKVCCPDCQHNMPLRIIKPSFSEPLVVQPLQEKVAIKERVGTEHERRDIELLAGGWTTVSNKTSKRARQSSTKRVPARSTGACKRIPSNAVVSSSRGGLRHALGHACALQEWSEVSLLGSRGNASLLGSVLPYRDLISIMGYLKPEDIARLSCCSRYLVHVGRDGMLWRKLFQERYPYSQLTADNMQEWRHCFNLEVNQIADAMNCFHSKLSFDEDVLGMPIDFTVNPRTRKVDYIRFWPELLSSSAYHGTDRVRHTTWNEPFKLWLPVFIGPDHFSRARLSIERTLVQLSPHWRSSRFHPHMVLEVLPKLLNTLVVLVSDKGVHCSDRALEGYCMVHRLLQAMVDFYPGLKSEARRRVEAFVRSPRARVKDQCASLGDFLPLLSICDGAWAPPATAPAPTPAATPVGGSRRHSIRDRNSCSHTVEDAAEGLWHAAAIPILQEVFDRNSLWICKEHPRFAPAAANKVGTGADAERLDLSLDAIKVSARLVMFHCHFLVKVAPRAHALNSSPSPGVVSASWDTHRPSDYYYGRPTLHLKESFRRHVQRILAVDTWPDFFAMARRQCPSPAQLTDLLKGAVHGSLKKGYHTKGTDFSRVQRSGVSRLLKSGEKYRVESSINEVSLELGSDSSMILCGACLLYEDTRFKQAVCYSDRSDASRAVIHSGDTQVAGKSQHTIKVHLGQLPRAVNRLFFTLCCCGGSNLSAFKNPSIKLANTAKPEDQLCQYTLASAGRAPTAIMACLLREQDGWQVKALDCKSRVRCCGNYGTVKKDIAQIRT